MVTLTIDNRTVTVPEGTTILEAARSARLDIPTLCKKIGADSLEYLTCEQLRNAIGLPSSELCTACFDGSYLENEDYSDLLEV